MSARNDAYASAHLKDVERALDKVREANHDLFSLLKTVVGKKAFRRIEEHQYRAVGNACGAITALSTEFGLVNDLGQCAVRGENGEFLNWEITGTLSQNENRKARRPPPAWAKDYDDTSDTKGE